MAVSGLYLVYVRGVDADARDFPGAVMLDDGLYLVRTLQTRSQLYHAIKRKLGPERLLVAPLTDMPKFMGMKPGSTKKAQALDAG